MFGLGGSGLASAQRAAGRRRRRRRAGTTTRHSVAKATSAGIPTADLRADRLVEDRRAGARAGRAADPSGAALDGRHARAARASRSSATSSCSAASGARIAPDAPFVAITGTNGKSTTTALIAHLLRSGRPRRAARRQYRHARSCRSSRRARPRACDRVSSYQIDLAPSLDPSVGILINVSETISTATARWRTTPR